MKNRFKKISLKSRVLSSIIFIVLLGVITISISVYIEFKENMFIFLDDVLISDVNAINFFVDSDSNFKKIKTDIDSYFKLKKDEYFLGYYIWTDNINQDVSRYIENKNPPQDNSYYIFDSSKNNRVIWKRYIKDGTKLPINIVVVRNSNHVLHEIEEFLGLLFIICASSVFLIVILTFILISWALKPIKKLSKNISEIMNEKGIVSKVKLPNPDNEPEELSPFITSFNNLIGKLFGFINKQKQFIADSSHELKTPIATIKSSIQVARHKKRTAEYYEKVLDNCLEDVERMNFLTEQLSLLAGLDEKLTRQESVIDLSKTVEFICIRFKNLAKEKGQNIICETESVLFKCDKQLMYSMIGNLIENAIKYSPKNKDILVSLKKESKDIVFTVHDEGGNIKEDDKHKIFYRFYRIDKGRSRDLGGAGLGLSIVKDIVGLYNGDIIINSNKKEGTTFTIKFKQNI